MMSRPASSCALMATEWHRPAPRARQRLRDAPQLARANPRGKAAGQALAIDQPLRLRIAADERCWKQHLRPLLHALSPRPRAAGQAGPARSVPRGWLRRADSAAALRSRSDARMPSNCAPGRTASGCRVRRLNRHDNAQDAATCGSRYDVIQAVNGCVGHVLRLQALNPVHEGLARETGYRVRRAAFRIRQCGARAD